MVVKGENQAISDMPLSLVQGGTSQFRQSASEKAIHDTIFEARAINLKRSRRHHLSAIILSAKVPS